MPNIGLCFQTTLDYLNDPTEEKYRKAMEAVKAAKSCDGGKEQSRVMQP